MTSTTHTGTEIVTRHDAQDDIDVDPDSDESASDEDSEEES